MMMAQSRPLSSPVFLPTLVCAGKVLQPWTSSRGEPVGSSTETKTSSLASPPASLEAQRQRFRRSAVQPGETPQETLSRLSDAAHRWLRPQECTKEQIVDTIILEQFLALLPVDMQVWLRVKGPGSSKEVAQLMETFLGQQEPTDVAKLAKSEWALTEPKQKTLYWEVMEENYENGTLAVLQVSKTDMPQTKASSIMKPEMWKCASPQQPGSIQPLSTSTLSNPDIPDIVVVDIKEEKDLWQEDPKKEGDEIVSQHIKQKEDDNNENWYWPQGRMWQGSHPWEGKEKPVHFGSRFERNHHPQSYSKNEQEVGHTSTSPGKTHKSISRFVTCQKRKTRGKLTYKRPESETDLCLGSDFIGHPKIFTQLKSYSCTNSENILNNSFAFHKHVASATRGAHYACGNCGESFACKSTLVNHQRIHTGNRPHISYECGKGFRGRSTLVCHQRIHTGEKPHQCHYCGKSFSVKSTLTIHQRLHTGEKPFNCPDCGRKFNQRAKLVYHSRTHTGERPYQCFNCGKGFTVHSSLVKHQRAHCGGKCKEVLHVELPSV